MPCEICGHQYAQLHRIKPGCWGGDYNPLNVVELCPNHHAAVHVFMKWYHRDKMSPDEWVRLEDYHTDGPLKRFCLEYVKPVVRQRLIDEGRWHPYVRVLPLIEEERRQNKVRSQNDKYKKRRQRDQDD